MSDYQARAYYQQNISMPHSYEKRIFTSKQKAIGWGKTYPNCFLVEVWLDGKLIIQLSRYSRKTWKHHQVY